MGTKSLLGRLDVHDATKLPLEAPRLVVISTVPWYREKGKPTLQVIATWQDDTELVYEERVDDPSNFERRHTILLNRVNRWNMTPDELWKKKRIAMLRKQLQDQFAQEGRQSEWNTSLLTNIQTTMDAIEAAETEGEETE